MVLRKIACDPADIFSLLPCRAIDQAFDVVGRMLKSHVHLPCGRVRDFNSCDRVATSMKRADKLTDKAKERITGNRLSGCDRDIAPIDNLKLWCRVVIAPERDTILINILSLTVGIPAGYRMTSYDLDGTRRELPGWSLL